MFAEFNWWLLIVGLVVGAGLTWLVLADGRRREVDLEEADLADEAAWLERTMAERGDPIDIATAEHLLRLHRAYLGLPPAEAVEPAEEVRDVHAAPPADAWSRAEPVPPADPWSRAEPAPPADLTEPGTAATDTPAVPPGVGAHDGGPNPAARLRD